MNKLKLFNYINYLFLIAFLLSVAVQFNDPDTLLWILIYGAAAAVCIFYILKKIPWFIPASVGFLALVWALLLLPDVIHASDSLNNTFSSWEMNGLEVEETREMFGLLIVTFWMFVLSVLIKKQPEAVKHTD